MRIACCALHYGKEYLAWAVRGVQDAVDEVHIFYTREPSYGFRDTTRSCPDSEAELRREASRFATKPVLWHDVTGVQGEGEHRDLMIAEAQRRSAEMYLVFDADEVWNPDSAKVSLDYAWNQNSAGRWLANFWNFFHSFEYMVIDHFTPVRIVDMRHYPFKNDALLGAAQPIPVLHFGYAQTLATMDYKFSCHGHKAEFKPGWFERFVKWNLGDVDMHPCINNFWIPERTWPQVKVQLSELMVDHPYFGKENVVRG